MYVVGSRILPILFISYTMTIKAGNYRTLRVEVVDLPMFPEKEIGGKCQKFDNMEVDNVEGGDEGGEWYWDSWMNGWINRFISR